MKCPKCKSIHTGIVVHNNQITVNKCYSCLYEWDAFAQKKIKKLILEWESGKPKKEGNYHVMKAGTYIGIGQYTNDEFFVQLYSGGWAFHFTDCQHAGPLLAPKIKRR